LDNWIGQLDKIKKIRNANQYKSKKKAMEETPIITARNLTIGYRSHAVHRGLNFALHRGELTGLLGANGAGKSTLLRTLSASQPALDGELYLNDRPLQQYTERERSRTLGVVLTDKTQAGGLTVYELVALGRQPHTGFFGRLHTQDHLRIQEAIRQVGIEHKADSYVAELSDGERQKVMIAKALVQECPVILLDEPTAYLDAVSRIEVMTLLHRLAAEQQKAILLSTHDVEQALVLCDRLWLLTDEHGLETGVTEDVILSHRMEHLFPGSTIRFDYDHGVYYPEVHITRSLHVTAPDDTLLHWTLNALNRHGWAALTDATDDDPSLPRLQVERATQMTLNLPHQDPQVIHSFEELLGKLNQ
jgi:iron complex transport system ATP-binding protein